jgi:hypothetical protein
MGVISPAGATSPARATNPTGAKRKTPRRPLWCGAQDDGEVDGGGRVVLEVER